HGLTPDEVERLVLESVEHAHEDFTTRRLIELRNKADADLRHTERALAQYGGQLPPGQRERIDRATAALLAAKGGTDVDALQQAVAEFGTATLPLAELQMNATARALLTGKREDQSDAENL